jgi:hypothetical protein
VRSRSAAVFEEGADLVVVAGEDKDEVGAFALEDEANSAERLSREGQADFCEV